MMTDPMVASLVREVLAEELARMRGDKASAPQQSAIREERVSITSDADLQSLVKRILTMAENPAERSALEGGNIVFRLANAAASVQGQLNAGGGGSHTFERGLLSERLVDQLPAGIKILQLGKHAQTTPLARDRLSQRGILIERMKQ
jgi:hypothetical protein